MRFIDITAVKDNFIKRSKKYIFKGTFNNISYKLLPQVLY